MAWRLARCTMPAVASLLLAGWGGAEPKTLAFREHGLAFRYPAGWSVTGFSRNVSPARLVVASYRVTPNEVEGDCGGAKALNKLPPKGAALLLVDYGAATPGLGFAPHPNRFLLRQFTRRNYDCFGDSYMRRFQAAGQDLQAFLRLGPQANTTTRMSALLILDSLHKVPGP